MEWQKKVFIAFVAVAAYRIIPQYLENRGVFEDVYSHTPGPCRYVDGLVKGAEDLAILPDGTVFVSSGMERLFNKTKTTRGQIFIFGLNNSDQPAVPLKLEGIDEDNFVPHGISVWDDKPKGRMILFVVNHHPDGDRVDQFEFHKEKSLLKHLSTFEDSKLTQANDVAATGPDSFYFTNYLFSTISVLKTVEMHMPMTWGSVYHWSKGFRPMLVARQLKQPNGITMAPDGKFVYVAHQGLLEIVVYSRLKDNSLVKVNNIQLNASVDNLSISPDGRTLWMANHVLWKIEKQIQDPEYPAPSQVLRLRLANDRVSSQSITEVYADDGSTLKGSSAAVFMHGKLLIGTALHKLMMCEIRSEQYTS